MSEDALLMTLCAICHVNPIKYTCPRCGIHTCSLPCVKKHKTWAQCSGVRNPAEYRKRSELETSSSIDKDYNFISKVERAVQSADNERVERQLHLGPARQLRPNQPRPKLEVELERMNITVIKAPTGLSRSKQNKTHWTSQQKCIMWTIEWIQQDGQKIVGQGLETKQIGEAYLNAAGKKNVLRKRKRENELAGQTHTSGKAENVTETRDGMSESLSTHSLPSMHEIPDETSHVNAAKIKSQEPDSVLEGLHFYLHRPNTGANLKCLVPLQQLHTLNKVLENRTVVEFPTIYVRTEHPSKLRSPFILEAEYLTNNLDAIAPSLDLSLDNRAAENSVIHASSETVSEQKILEGLVKDLAE